MKTNPFLVLVYVFFLILGCSKGDDTVTMPPKQQKPPTVTPDLIVLTGVFKDSEVQGLSYETTTQSGITNDKGEFSYVEGENITFKVGSVPLGTLPAEELITPISIARQAEAEATVSSTIAGNIAALLQTLDEDQNHQNGIEITGTTASILGVDEIDFSAPIANILADIVLNVSQNNGTYLNVVYPHTAIQNMATSLGIELEASDNFTVTHFLPFLKSFYTSAFYQNTPPSAVHKHEFDMEGNLVSTDIVLRYSGRTIFSFVYDSYSNTGQPASGSISYAFEGLPLGYGTFPPSNDIDIAFEINFDSENHIAAFQEFFNGSSIPTTLTFQGYDDVNRPLSWSREFKSEDGLNDNATRHILTYSDNYLATERVERSSDFNNGESESKSSSVQEYTYAIDGSGNYEKVVSSLESRYTANYGDEEIVNNYTDEIELLFSYNGNHTLEHRTENRERTSDMETTSSKNIYSYDSDEYIIFSSYSGTNGFKQENTYNRGVRSTTKNFTNGVIDRQVEYIPSGGEIDSKFFYDEKGSLIQTNITELNADFFKIKETILDSNDEISQLLFFNDAGLVVTSESYFKGELSSILEYEYDVNGRTDKTIFKDADGNLQSEEVYAYDPNGLLNSVERFDAVGTLTFIFNYEYDTEGLLSELTTLDPNGNILRIDFYEAGLYIRSEIYDGNGNLVDTTATAKRSIRRLKDASKNTGSGHSPNGLDASQVDYSRSKAALQSKHGIESISKKNQVLIDGLGRNTRPVYQKVFR